MRHWKRWLLVVVGIVLLVAVGFVVWALTPPAPLPEALSALSPAGSVRVDDSTFLTFAPLNSEVEKGFIFYPGGRVDARSYAPLARAIAERGFLVTIVPMPLNLAIFNPSAAADVIQRYPDIERWAVGGHSLGGAMAAQFAHDRHEQLDGLVLWAAYPSASSSLVDSAVKVLSIYGTLDGLSTLDKIAESRQLLPADTMWVAIEGGNHAQFGWYGAQGGDNPAAISREEQQNRIVDATAEFLAALRAESEAS